RSGRGARLRGPRGRPAGLGGRGDRDRRRVRGAPGGGSRGARRRALPWRGGQRPHLQPLLPGDRRRAVQGRRRELVREGPRPAPAGRGDRRLPLLVRRLPERPGLDRVQGLLGRRGGRRPRPARGDLRDRARVGPRALRRGAAESLTAGRRSRGGAPAPPSRPARYTPAMPPRFDPARRTLDLAVADLLDASLLRSLGFANRGGYERLWLGQAIHSRYQEEALGSDATYRREVVVVHRFEHRFHDATWAVSVQGRIDGLRREPDGTLVVEEIKSVRRGGQLLPHVREMYQRQALLYAWMLAASPDPERSGPVRADLVLISIGGGDGTPDGDTEREVLELDARAIELSVRRRLNLLIHTWEANAQAAEDRRRAAERLRFPYPQVRPGQEEILAAAETAVANREHLLLQ